MLIKKSALIIWCLLFALFYFMGCVNEPEKIEEKSTRETVDYIRKIPGTDDSIPTKLADKGEVLIAYSDCNICHKEDERSVGPAFRDIAKRYPVNKPYIEMLARKVIKGGSGSWGSAVMDAHPKLAIKDAKMMVTYILSLKK